MIGKGAGQIRVVTRTLGGARLVTHTRYAVELARTLAAAAMGAVKLRRMPRPRSRSAPWIRAAPSCRPSKSYSLLSWIWASLSMRIMLAFRAVAADDERACSRRRCINRFTCWLRFRNRFGRAAAARTLTVSQGLRSAFEWCMSASKTSSSRSVGGRAFNSSSWMLCHRRTEVTPSGPYWYDAHRCSAGFADRRQ
jgi:hypothetical protein